MPENACPVADFLQEYPMRTAIFAVLMLGLTIVSGGCSHTYDGSEKFSDQMPQYNYGEDNPTPAYMHPGDSDSMSP